MSSIDERIDALQGEMNALLSLLRDTDYASNKLVENLSDCDTLEKVFAACQAHHAKYGDVIVKRRRWRERINAIEAELEELESQREQEEPAAPEADKAEDATPDAQPEPENEGDGGNEEEVIVDDPEEVPESTVDGE